MHMDCMLKELSHGKSPGQMRMGIYNTLHSSQLMGHTQLTLPGRGFQLPTITVTYPYFRMPIPHDFLDHSRTAITADHMVNTFSAAKHPFPGICPIDAVRRFIAVDHLALSNAFLDMFGFCNGPFPSPLHDLVNSALADLYLVQIKQGLLRADIAHMLFLAIVHHGCFQPASEPAMHLQSCGGCFHLFDMALRTVYSILAYFNYLGRGLGQLTAAR